MNKDVLQEKLNKNGSKLKIGAVVLAIALGLKFLVSANEDSLIVDVGIRIFGILSIIATAVLVVVALGFVVILAMFLTASAALKKQKIIEEADSNVGPVLKVKGKLDPTQIRNSLLAEGDNWIKAITAANPKEADEMEEALSNVRQTMTKMDDYQQRLKNLLDSNGADALRDTEEVLDRVEQHLCRNVRKLLNIMTVSSPNTQNDLDVVELTAKNCAEDNDRLLKTTKEFIVAVTEFLNSQGDSGSDINEVEVYKNALTTQIEEGGIYS
ncbi:MAG: hypothetical protein J5802_06785 [Butyrivibrio sp.]|nr:hypothetical protein [Butyrivibrio sp.]